MKKRREIEPADKNLPLYPIGVAARMLGVHPRTLRIYEHEDLIRPHRVGTRRLYSRNDLQWIACLRSAIHDQGISIPGIKKLLRYATCHEIVECPEEVCCSCEAVVDRVIPRGIRLAGDRQAEERIAEEERRQRLQERTGRGKAKATKASGKGE